MQVQGYNFPMLIWTIIKVALKSIAANKLRSVLTMIGIIIGVASVIAMLGLGAGTEEKITASVRAMGANLLVVRPSYRSSGGVASETQRDLTLGDAEAIVREVPQVVQVAPDVSSRYQAKYMNKNTNVTVSGQAATYFAVRNFEVEKGRIFTDAEVNRGAKVAVLGPKTATDLFGFSDPLDETIKINNINFRVIGVTRAKGEQQWFNPDEQIVVPITVAMTQLARRESVNSIYLQIENPKDMLEAETKASEVLRRRHRIQVGQEDDFTVRNLQERADSLKQVSDMFTMLLAGVASISLLVGGIGIMNIMLVSVTERTREIGIRKALGARNRDLMTQFLLEAVVVSLTGGILGICIGTGIIHGFNYLMTVIAQEYTAQLQMTPIILSFVFSVLVGIFFGWYPARKAARMDPIEALRYE